MEEMVLNCPDNPFTPLPWHAEPIKDLFCHLSSQCVVAMGSNLVILIFSDSWLAYIME
jgi:hypothetical protein